MSSERTTQRKEIIDRIAASTGETKARTEKIVNSMLSEIENALVNGEQVTFTGFGTFKTSDTTARMGRNPQTGEAKEIPASKRVSFKVGQKLKDSVKATA